KVLAVAVAPVVMASVVRVLMSLISLQTYWILKIKIILMFAIGLCRWAAMVARTVVAKQSLFTTKEKFSPTDWYQQRSLCKALAAAAAKHKISPASKVIFTAVRVVRL